MNSIDKESLFFGINNVEIEHARLITVGIPWDHSSSYRKGSSEAPNYIRQATTSSLYNPFSEKNTDLKEQFQLYDYGNINNENANPLLYQKAVLSAINEIYSKNRTCYFLFLGGDHLSTYFSFSSLVESGFYSTENSGIIYLDAHPDLYDIYEGNKFSHACVLRRIIDETNINPSNIVQVGIRAVTPEQVEYAHNNGIKMVSRKEFQSSGPEGTAKVIRGIFDKNIDKIYLSVDMDVLDPSFAPGVGNPEPGGLITTEVIDFIHNISKLPLHSFDIVECCPKYDHSHVTAFIAAKTIKETLSIMI
ncbi:MAG: agmatinase [Candidatus Hodarchaeota archaeon]